MSISTDDLGRITQQTSVVTADGDNLGKINQIYTSDTTGDPAWVTLKTGLFGSQASFVPLADAAFDGDDIRVGVSKDAVHGAPRIDDDGHLSVDEEDELYRYYGLHNPGGPADDAAAPTADRPGGVTDDDAGDDADDDDQNRDAVPAAAAVAGAGAGAGAAASGDDRDDELAQRDVEGRDEVVDAPEAAPRRAQDDDERSVHAEDGPEPATTSEPDGSSGSDEAEGVKPGERTTRLRRYVVTERVVQTIEELPDEPAR